MQHNLPRGEIGRISGQHLVNASTPSAHPPTSPLPSMASPVSSPAASRIGSPDGSVAESAFFGGGSGRDGGGGGSGGSGGGDDDGLYDNDHRSGASMEDERVIWGTSVNVQTARVTFRRFIENFRGRQHTNEHGQVIEELDESEGEDVENDSRAIYLRALHNLAITGKKVRHKKIELVLFAR